MFGEGALALLNETRGLLVSAALDPLLAEPDTVVPLEEYRERAVRGRFGALVLLPARLAAAVAAAEEAGVLLVSGSGLVLSERARVELASIRSFVEGHHRARFGSRW